MDIDLSLDPTETAQKITDFLKKAVLHSGLSHLVIGLSGGLDSATVLTLASQAVDKENIFVALLPYGELNKEGINDAQLVISQLQISNSRLVSINIKPLVDPIFALDQNINNLRKGNIMARIRMMLLFDLAKKHQTLVLGTENRTEYLLGYFTRFGDQASDLEPLLNLYKTQVKQLAVFLKIPERIIKKAPSAGLWPGQTDENEFGFTYQEADKILFLLVEKNYGKEKIIQAGFAEELVEKVLKRVEENKFKHSLPYSLR